MHRIPVAVVAALAASCFAGSASAVAATQRLSSSAVGPVATVVGPDGTFAVAYRSGDGIRLRLAPASGRFGPSRLVAGRRFGDGVTGELRVAVDTLRWRAQFR